MRDLKEKISKCFHQNCPLGYMTRAVIVAGLVETTPECCNCNYISDCLAMKDKEGDCDESDNNKQKSGAG